MAPPSARSPSMSGPPRQLSRWSIVSLLLLPVATAIALLPTHPVRHNSVDDPGLGAALTAMMYAGFVIASLCVLVGFVTGWIGARRSRGSKLLARAGMALHGT